MTVPQSGQAKMFAGDADEFAGAIGHFGFPPTSIWSQDRFSSLTQRLISLCEDTGSSRPSAEITYQKKPSIFSPVVMLQALSIYCPAPPARIYDPFGGGGTRAIVAGHLGHEYSGIELRRDESDRVNYHLERLGLNERCCVHEGDSTRMQPGIPDDWADFIFTCPPYWDLEQYKGGPDDLSMQTWSEFGKSLRKCMTECARISKPGTWMAWVVGLHRHSSGPLKGQLVPLPQATVDAARQAGWLWMEEAIMVRSSDPNKVGPEIQRLHNATRATGHLSRAHEYIEVFALPNDDGSVPQTPRPGEAGSQQEAS